MEDRLNLQLQTRSSSSSSSPPSNNYNLFIRLDPSIVKKLYSTALINLNEVEEKDDILSFWSILQEEAKDHVIDFLPLELILKESQTPMYTSYNGGSLSHSTNDSRDMIEIPSTLLPPDVPPTNHIISVKPLIKIYNAKSIQLKPLSNSDWESIEIYSDYLESEGGLLQQVSVVYPLQILELQLKDGVKVKVQVLSRGFGDLDIDDQEEEGEQDDDDDSTIAYSSSSSFGSLDDFDEYEEEDFNKTIIRPKYKCLRLVADTQVIILPKPRTSSSSQTAQQKEEEKWNEPSPPLRISPTRQDLKPTLDYLSRHKEDFSDQSDNEEEEDSDSDVSHDDFDLASYGKALVPSPPCLSVSIHTWTWNHYIPGSNFFTASDDENSNDEEDDDEKDIFALMWKSSDSLSSPSQTDKTKKDQEKDEQQGNNPSINSNHDDKNNAAVVKILLSDQVSPGNIAIHTDVRCQLGVTPLYDKVHVQLLTPHQIQRSIKSTKKALHEGVMEVNVATISVVPPEEKEEQQNSIQSWWYPDDYGISYTVGSDSCSRVTTRHSGFDSSVPSCLTRDEYRIECKHSSIVSSGSLLRASLTYHRQDNITSRSPVSIIQEVAFQTLEKNKLGNERGNVNSMDRNDDTNGAFPNMGPHLSQLPPLLSVDDLSEALGLATAISDQPPSASGKTAFQSTLPEKKDRNSSRAATTTIPCKKPTRRVRMPRYEYMLNLLPQTPSFKRLYKKAGKIIQQIHGEITSSLDEQPIESVYRKVRTSKNDCLDGILITGEGGSGKTHLTLLVSAALRARHGMATIYFDCKRLQSSATSQLKNILNEISSCFRSAFLCQPCVLVVDNLDSLLPNVDISNEDDDGSISHVQQMNPMVVNQVKIISEHFNMLKEELNILCNDTDCPDKIDCLPSSSTAKQVVLLCTSQSSNSLFHAARLVGAFSLVTDCPSMDTSERFDLFIDICFRHDIHRDARKLLKGLFLDFGKKTEGYRPHDLKICAFRARKFLHIRALGREIKSMEKGSTDYIYDEECQSPRGLPISSKFDREVFSILSNYTPLSRQRVRLKRTKFTDWSSIGGLFRAKAKLTEIITRPVRYSHIYKHAPVKLPRGILLFGPPGCGKSHLVPALAKECNLNLVTCNGPELLDKYIGASEAKVRDLFTQAQMASPAMLFLDEFDALAPRRGTDHTGVTDRVVNQLLTFLDGVENVGKKGSILYIVAATSRPDKIDPALIRPGRLEKHVFVGHPESALEWSNIFWSISRQWDIDEEVKRILTNGELVQSIPNMFPHAKTFSGADMKGVFDTAHLNAVHDHLNTKDCTKIPAKSSLQHKGGSEEVRVTIKKSHLFHAIESTRPSLSKGDHRMFRRIFSPFLKSDKPERDHPEGSKNDLSGPSSSSNRWDSMDEKCILPSGQKHKLRTTLH